MIDSLIHSLRQIFVFFFHIFEYVHLDDTFLIQIVLVVVYQDIDQEIVSVIEKYHL